MRGRLLNEADLLLNELGRAGVHGLHACRVLRDECGNHARPVAVVCGERLEVGLEKALEI